MLVTPNSECLFVVLKPNCNKSFDQNFTVSCRVEQVLLYQHFHLTLSPAFEIMSWEWYCDRGKNLTAAELPTKSEQGIALMTSSMSKISSHHHNNHTQKTFQSKKRGRRNNNTSTRAINETPCPLILVIPRFFGPCSARDHHFVDSVVGVAWQAMRRHHQGISDRSPVTVATTSWPPNLTTVKGALPMQCAWMP